jgi:hypothetical protein
VCDVAVGGTHVSDIDEDGTDGDEVDEGGTNDDVYVVIGMDGGNGVDVDTVTTLFNLAFNTSMHRCC